MSIARCISPIEMVAIMDGLTHAGGRCEFDRMAGLLDRTPRRFARQLFSTECNDDDGVFHSAINLFSQYLNVIDASMVENICLEDVMEFMASQIREMILKHVRLPLGSELVMIVLDTLQRAMGQRVLADQIALGEVVYVPEEIDPRFGNGY